MKTGKFEIELELFTPVVSSAGGRDPAFRYCNTVPVCRGRGRNCKGNQMSTDPELGYFKSNLVGPTNWHGVAVSLRTLVIVKS